MKVIFLDFDGVLNSAASFHMELRVPREQRKCPVNETLCRVCCSNLQFVIDQTPGVKIVLSTTWRELFDMDWLRAKLLEYGVDGTLVIDRTPSSFRSRGHEIEEWLMDHPEVHDFVIIDDNDDGISSRYGKPGLNASNFVQTSWLSGMDLSHALRAIKVLGGDDDMHKLPL
jgi:hypothetical protein